MTNKCKVKGCINNVYSDGLCMYHFNEKIRNMTIGELRERQKLNQICTVESCTRKSDHAGLCSKHYYALRRYDKRINPDFYPKCKVKGCNEVVDSLGRCTKHYQQYRKYRNITDKKQLKCKVEGCNNNYFANGLCSKHYTQMRNHGEILEDKQKIYICKVKGCNNKNHAKGFCISHYREYILNLRNKSLEIPMLSGDDLVYLISLYDKMLKEKGIKDIPFISEFINQKIKSDKEMEELRNDNNKL